MSSPGQTITTYHHNISQHLQAPSKRSQHFSTTYHNIVGRSNAFGHAVATCCAMLSIENRTSAHARVQHSWTNLAKRLQQHATSTTVVWKIGVFQIWANKTQHVATPLNGVLKASDMLRTTMLRPGAFWRNSLPIAGQTHEKLTSIFFSQWQIVRYRSLKHRVNCIFMCLSAYRLYIVYKETKYTSYGLLDSPGLSKFATLTREPSRFGLTSVSVLMKK